MSDDPYIEIDELLGEIDELRCHIINMGWNFMEFITDDKIVFGCDKDNEVRKMRLDNGVWMTDLGVFNPMYFMRIPTNFPEKYPLTTTEVSPNEKQIVDEPNP